MLTTNFIKPYCFYGKYKISSRGFKHRLLFTDVKYFGDLFWKERESMPKKRLKDWLKNT